MTVATNRLTANKSPLFAALLVFLLTPGLRADQPEVKKEPPRKGTPDGEVVKLDHLVPETVDDLRALQEQVKKTLKKVIPATVGLQVGGASGSGVIIDKEGHVLTAGHVSGQPGRKVTIILHDGRRLAGKTLGANNGIDSGLVKITEKGNWPVAELGKSDELKKGQWVISVGHPGGFQTGRAPVVRLGRVQQSNDSLISTDCTLVGGDSGGPLFDLSGRVVGIHSRIGLFITANIHVPVNTYKETWDRLVKAEVWGGRLGRPTPANAPWMGVERDETAKECRIKRVVPGSPAARAGLKENDIIRKFDGRKIDSFDDLGPAVLNKKIGDKVKVEIVRGNTPMTLELTLGKRE